MAVQIGRTGEQLGAVIVGTLATLPLPIWRYVVVVMFIECFWSLPPER
jgi:hypothetical protein